MTDRAYRAIAAACLSLLWCCTVPDRTAAAGNMLANPGFEEGGGATPNGWTVEEKTARQGSIGTAGKAHSGERSLKLAPNGSNRSNGDGPLRVAQVFPGDRVRGKRLYVSGWLAAEGGATAILTALAFHDNGGVSAVELRRTDAEFALDQKTLDIPGSAKIKFFAVGCSVEGRSGAAYFDDVWVGTSPAETAAAPSPKAPQEAAGPVAPATIEVDAGRELRPIPRTLYGANIEWIWDANGLWDPKRGALDESLVKLTRDLGVSLLRFPGGVFSDYYHWRNGVGPQANRPETPHTTGEPRSRNAFGTDESLDLASKVGAELLITVNASSGTAQEAADWVRYTQGRVRLWEVGNELYIKDRIGLTPEKYAQRFLEYARAMRAASPSIRIGAIIDENYSSSVQRAYPDWTERVVRAAGREIDFVSVHFGYAPMMAVDPGTDVRSVYRALLAAPSLIGDTLGKLSQKLDRLAPGRDIRIAMTEWGPLFQGGQKDRFVDHVKTLGSGLYAASVMNAMLQNPRTDIATFFKLVDALFAGWIGRRGNGWAPKAPYFAMQMYTQHFGDRLVASTARSETFSSPAVGWVQAAGGVPYLDVVASRGSSGKRLYVLAVNRHFDQPIRAEIRLRGFRPKGGATAWTLNGAGIDANTGTELFRAPGVSWARQAGDEKNPRIDRGGPGEIGIASARVRDVAGSFEYSFPAHSLTSIEIEGESR